MNASRSIHLIVIASTVVTFVAGCASVPTARQTVAVPPPARSLDLLEVATDAAKAVGLPSVTKLDKANGVVEFASLEAPATGYTAQVRQRPDGQLDVTVKRGSPDVPGGVEAKARELVAALDARLRQGPKATQPSPTPSSPQPPPRAPAATPSAPAPPSTPSRQEPAPPRRSEPVITLVITVPQANLRDRGDAKAKLVRVLPKNTRVTVLGKANEWYLVRLDDGTEGWLAESVTSPAR